MVTKVKSGVIGDNTVGITQLNVSDGSNGQVLTTNGSGTLSFSTISGGASAINDLSDAKTFSTDSILLGNATTGTINEARRDTGLGYGVFNNLTEGDRNTGIGYNALLELTTGYENTIVGSSAGDAITSGDYNTAIGASALGKTNTGSYNTALGRRAMLQNTTGNYNTAVGYNSLEENTTAEESTAVGYEALNDNTTGAKNTAVGFRALDKNTTGTENTGIGGDALGTNTTGNYNTAIGRSAGRVATGSENVYMGVQAGDDNTGSGNVIIGHQAGYNQTSGNTNVYVGQHTAYNSGTGYANTCLGYSAGYHLGGGYRNVAIGYAVSIPSGQHHRYAIGYNNAGGNNTAYQSLSVHNGSSGYVRLTVGSTTVSASSDERIKKDIEDMPYGLSFVNRLRPVNYKLKLNSELSDEWRTEGVEDHDVGWQNGFIAQEVKAALDAENIPADKVELWSEDADNHGLQSLGEASLIPMLVKSIQELKTELDAAKARITTLEG